MGSKITSSLSRVRQSTYITRGAFLLWASCASIFSLATKCFSLKKEKMNLLLQLLGIWLWVPSWRVNGEAVMCFWISWFPSGFPSQTKVGPLQNGARSTSSRHDTSLWALLACLSRRQCIGLELNKDSFTENSSTQEPSLSDSHTSSPLKLSTSYVNS